MVFFGWVCDEEWCIVQVVKGFWDEGWYLIKLCLSSGLFSRGCGFILWFVLVLLGFFSFFFCIVDGGVIYFDLGDEEQLVFEICVGFVLFFVFLVDEGICLDIVDMEGNQNFFFGFDCFFVMVDKFFSLGVDYFVVDVGVFYVVCCVMEGCDGYGEEWFILVDWYFVDVIEVVDIGGVQVEIFGFLGLGVVVYDGFLVL